MTLGDRIHQIRTEAKLSQGQFAALLEVSQQSVGKWESGKAQPDPEKLIRIAKHFDLSLDALILGNSNREVEELRNRGQIKPRYANIHDWEFYSSHIQTEYRQCLEEGLDVEKYADLFTAVSLLPKDEIKKKLGDTLFEIVSSAAQKEGYPYTEPSDLESIRALCALHAPIAPDRARLQKQIEGAWMGRVIGCMLGKTVEGMKRHELIPFLQETDNYPMHRFIRSDDLTEERLAKYKYRLANRCYADKIDGMPVDDDTNYTVLAQQLIEKYGRNFTPDNMADFWLAMQPKNAYCTAERVAFCNFVKGYRPPDSAVYKNPFREWIGAQIRGDYFGYINPGDPAAAAEMAWRDASISHVKNGIYGEQLIAAMVAKAAVTADLEEILQAGLDHIPATSRLHAAITAIRADHAAGISYREAVRKVCDCWNDRNVHDWCHTISNAELVTIALLYGNGDFARSICMAVENGFDTDCNGATVGSILGMALGIDAIPAEWKAPFNDTLYTSIFGTTVVKISACAAKTMEHIL
ncbi:MAG: ADP-ribosylglycohydrolase family protein [Clostridia bacterium]|nr:ADP-ribosylglycohydrolase family protein [Clostridia bacterium]